MSSASASNTPPDGYFNDLSKPTGNGGNGNGSHKRARSPSDTNAGPDTSAGAESTVPKPKRIACVICRKRKLKCDGTKPSCSTCTRLGHNCAYDEVRRKSGPKRGYVKALEERLKQVETLLKTQEPSPVSAENSGASFPNGQLNTSGIGLHGIAAGDFTASPSMGIPNGVSAERWGFNGESPPLIFGDINIDMNLDEGGSAWEMIGLGLEEPMPPQETIDELHQIYFDKIHPSLPMMHRYRYLAAMNLAPSQRPPVALRYAMWTLAASVTDKFMDLKDHFYHRSRKYMELDYLKGHGESLITIAHAQTHILLASYEFKMMYFPRAWMSTGSATRLCQMMGLHRLDGAGLDVKQCLPPPRDWTEKEERRRTFWMAFCEDRYASIGTGWPMSIDEKDIMSDLPTSDEAFELSKPEATQTLAEALNPSGASNLSAFAGVALMACLFGRNLTHLHRPDADDRDNDLNGEFWKRHRNMDNILLNTSLSMPPHLKLPSGLSNPNIVFTNMNIHTSTICLHQAAIYKADKNGLPPSISAESKVRCITAANEIANVMRMISHQDLSAMNPFISFCLYVSARVFVQFLKSRPDDSQTADSLRFLLSAMNAMKRKNPLTESFLVQLDVDLEGLGMRNPLGRDRSASAYCGLDPAEASKPFPQAHPPSGIALYSNDYNFSNAAEDNSSPRTTALSGVANSTKDGSRLSQDQTTTSKTGAGRENWLSINNHPIDHGQEVQRNMQGLVIGSGSLLDLSNHYPSTDMNGSSTYGATESTSGADTSLSPDTSNSNRPTPNSTTPSDSRPSLHQGRTSSGRASFETSPESTQNNGLSGGDSQGFMYGNHTDFTVPPTGMTPDNTFGMGDGSSQGYGMGGAWDVNSQSSNLTPVGEGVFRSLMGLGPNDPMELNWEGNN